MLSPKTSKTTLRKRRSTSRDATTLANAGLWEIRVHRDGDEQDRAIEARRPDLRHSPGTAVAQAARLDGSSIYNPTSELRPDSTS